ncbi:MAG: FHA domain-containing protein [Planctomycetes bacterium]|nr:FHA domain-containing protein [Planctomycetota bacterium]
MSTRNVSSTDQPQETLTTEAQDDAPAKPGKPLQRGPYLRISSPVTSCSEFNLPARPTTIGRSDEVDIKLADPAVSQTHAVITCEDNKFLVKDLASKLGTTVNGEPITSHHLQHDDVIQISQHILQFQAHTVQTMASRVAAKAEELLRTKFRLLPSNLQAKYRILGIPPEKIFEPGDTLRMERAGLLIPVKDSPGDSTCVEVHLTWPNGSEGFFLGGIMGVIMEFGVHWICVKLHALPLKTQKAVVELANPGPWLNCIPT